MNKPAIDNNRVSSTVQNKGPAVLIPAPPQSTTQPAVVDHNRVSSTVQNEGPAVLIPAPPQSTTQPAVVDHNRVSSTVQNEGPAVLIPAPPQSTTQPAVVDHNRVSSTVQNKGPAVLLPAPPQSTTQPAVVDHNRVSSALQANSETIEPIPKSLLCPIGYTLMVDPVVCADGHSYDRAAIEEWLRLHNTSPLTNQPLPNKHLIPNHLAKMMIEEFNQKKQG
jgi:hypothetical protein